MSRVLCSEKKVIVEQHPAMLTLAENLAELSWLVKSLAEKMDRLEAFSQKVAMVLFIQS